MIKLSALAAILILYSFSSSANPEIIPLAVKTKYHGCWNSTIYSDKGEITFLVNEVKKYSVNVKYLIKGSDVFDGFPYPKEKTIKFEIDFDKNSKVATVKYRFPSALFLGLLTKAIELTGTYEISDSNSLSLQVLDEEIELWLNLSSDRIEGRYSYTGLGEDSGVFFATSDGGDDSRAC